MLRSIKTVLSCMMISVSLVSCSSLKSEHYVGELLPAADEEIVDASLWEFDNQVFFVNVIDSSTLAASTLRRNKEKKEHEIIKSKIILTELEKPGAYFLNMKESTEDLYTILLLVPTKSEKAYLVYTVDNDIIKKHIKEGKVKAVQKGNDYILQLSKEELDKYIGENIETIFTLGNAGIVKALNCVDIIK
jgi:hypothetical protein